MTVTDVPVPAFSAAELPGLCDKVGALDPDLRRIVDEYGYPEFWNRPNTFESLVWFILEQIVALSGLDADPRSPFCYAVSYGYTKRLLAESGCLVSIARASDPWWMYAYSTMFASIREQRWAAVSDEVRRLTGYLPVPVRGTLASYKTA